MKKLNKQIIAYLSAESYTPIKRHELVKALGIKQEKSSAFRKTLKKLEAQGVLVRLHKNRYALASRQDSVTGSLSIHPKGHGLVSLSGEKNELFVSRKNLYHAISGDIVRVAPLGTRQVRGPRAGRLQEARILEIIERKKDELVGLLMKQHAYDYVIPDDPAISENIHVNTYSETTQTVAAYHKVVVKLDAPEKGVASLSGTVIEDLGHQDAPGVDVLSLVRGKGIRTAHTDQTTTAATKIELLQNSNTPDRRDLRKQTIFTIDPVDAKDYDDAISLEKTDEGLWRLGVHIADVAHYITPESPIDAEALIRGNTVYMVDRTIPMLPADLTANICSLLPSEDRVTHTVDMLLDEDGNIVSHETYPSLICSAARLNYGQVQALFDGKKNTGIPEHIQSKLHELHDLSRRLRRARMENGSVNLNMPEVKCLLDKQGKATSIHIRKAVEAYQLIEEFMLLANQVVAKIFIEAKVPGLFRIHPGPDEKQWKEMADALHVLGIPDAPKSRKGINRVAKKVKGTPIEYAASLAILKTFNQANYSAACEHHFGLAFDRYTHFTSPIRRYPDLIVHRILGAIEKNKKPIYSPEQLADIAHQCSITERTAVEAERESLQLKRVEYFDRLYKQGKRGPFKAMITTVLRKGLIIELFDTLQRGLIPFSTMGDDRYRVNTEKTKATGDYTNSEFKIGMVLEVELLRVDLQRKLIDFCIANSRPRVEKHSAKKIKRKKRRR